MFGSDQFGVTLNVKRTESSGEQQHEAGEAPPTTAAVSSIIRRKDKSTSLIPELRIRTESDEATGGLDRTDCSSSSCSVNYMIKFDIIRWFKAAVSGATTLVRWFLRVGPLQQVTT